MIRTRLRCPVGRRLGCGAALALLVAALDLTAAGCDTTAPDGNSVPSGGVGADAGAMTLEDVWIDAPHGARAGADTGLRLYLDNESDHADALVKVSTPLAPTVRLMDGGHPVTRIPVAANSAQDLEWRADHDGVELVHLRHAVARGQWYPMTFVFSHSPAVTVQVTLAPLGIERDS